ncbi:MAG: hypothetical protein AAGF95_27955 [Chloroflexota bacterium]
MSQHNQDDTFLQRWCVLPRLLQLLWELGRRDVLMIAGFSLINGLAPLLSLLVLQRFVDSTADAISGNIGLSVALVWLALLFVVEGLKAIFGFWESLIEDVQNRLTARAQERLLQKAGRLSLAAFESPMLFDQLHRAQQGLDKRLLNVPANSLLSHHYNQSAGVCWLGAYLFSHYPAAGSGANLWPVHQILSANLSVGTQTHPFRAHAHISL